MNGYMGGTYSSINGYMIIVEWTNRTDEMDRYKYEWIYGRDIFSINGYMIIVEWTNRTDEMDRYKYEWIFYSFQWSRTPHVESNVVNIEQL